MVARVAGYFNDSVISELPPAKTSKTHCKYKKNEKKKKTKKVEKEEGSIVPPGIVELKQPTSTRAASSKKPQTAASHRIGYLESVVIVPTVQTCLDVLQIFNVGSCKMCQSTQL